MSTVILVNFGQYKTRAVFLNEDDSEKELIFTPDGQLWTFTGLSKVSLDGEWSLITRSAQFDDPYLFTHFQKKPSLMTDYERKMTTQFWDVVYETLKRYNPNEFDSDFIFVITTPHIWDWEDKDAYERLLNHYVNLSDEDNAGAHNPIVQQDPTLLPIIDDTPSFLIGIDYGDGETSASVYDINGELTAKEGERLRRLNLGVAGNITKIYSALRTVRYQDGREDYRLMMSPDDLTGTKFDIHLKRKVSEMNDEQKNNAKRFWKLVFDAIISNNDFLKYDTTARIRNFMLAVACPTGWTDEEMYSYRSLMIDAGVPADMIMKESEAAYNKWRTKTQDTDTLVVDFGSSTIDLTYVENNSIHNLPLESPVGAKRIEELIHSALGKKKLFCDDCRVFQSFLMRNGISYDLDRAIRLAIRKAKEDFYSDYEEQEELEIIFNKRKISNELKGNLVEEYLSKKQVEDIIASYIGEVRNYFKRAKDYLGDSFSPSHIIISGGASRMPFVKDCINEVFNINEKAIIFHDKDDADHVVSDGLALTSIDYSVEAGHKGDKWWRIKEMYDDWSEGLKEYTDEEDGSLTLNGEPTLLGVKKNGKWGWVNVNNEFEIQPEYDNVYPCCYNGYIALTKNGLWGALNRKDGSIAINFEYAYLSVIYKNTFLYITDRNGWWGGLIKPGNIRLTPAVYKFKEGPYGRYCDYIKKVTFLFSTTTVSGRIDLETGKEM